MRQLSLFVVILTATAAVSHGQPTIQLTEDDFGNYSSTLASELSSLTAKLERMEQRMSYAADGERLCVY